MPRRHYDAVIIGGGAAGLFCGAMAGRRGRRVAVLEHNSQVGRKILISGGGRCNFTNIHTSPENFVSRNPHFSKSALARYAPADFVELVKKHKIPFYEKKLGQLFCRESARAIVDLLLAECRDANVDVITSCKVNSVSKTEHFEVDTGSGNIETGKVVIACGGLSFAKIGATGFGYELARQFGLKIEPARPSLVAMVLEGKGSGALPGVSLDANVSTAGQTFRENILFTHRGLSGPAILQISNYWKKGSDVVIDLLPGTEVSTLLTGKRNVTNSLSMALPARFAESFIPPTLGSRGASELTAREMGELEELLHNWHVRFKDTEGYDRAEVTIGGVSTDELSSKTMEAKKVPGLYFIGEVVDVTGWLGGYNFQWAWASAFAAAKDL